MYNLVLKDILIQKKQLFIIFALQRFGEVMFSGGVVAFTYILVVTSCAIEDKNKADVMLNSLPLKKSTIVLAKYASVFVYFVLGTAAYSILTSIFGIMELPIKIYPLTLKNFIGGLVGVSLMYGIYLPIFFKVGYTRSKTINFILFFGFFFGISYLVSILKKYQNSALLKNITEFLQHNGDAAAAAIILALMLVILSVSYYISLKLYKSREF